MLEDSWKKRKKTRSEEPKGEGKNGETKDSTRKERNTAKR